MGIGSRVRKGDLLLRIGAPDLNAQLAQAAAQLGQAKAALAQARASALAAQGWETRQNANNAKAGVQSGAAAVDAAQAAVTAGTGGGTALFSLENEAVLRVQVQVPQSGAVPLRDGLQAKVQVPELPGQDFAGTVARNAVAVDPASRAVLVEVDLPNADHCLRPGLYVTVAFQIPRDHPGVVIPDEAVLFNGQGVRVAVVGADNVVHMHDVTIARDLGR